MTIIKILVFSDSHGYCDNMLRIIETEAPDHVIHLGDHSSDVAILKKEHPTLPIVSVRGNCDYFDATTPDTISVIYDGVRVLATHGHKYGVKSSLLRMFMAAKENAVHIALFGHTHCTYCQMEDGIWLLNPGSCGYGSRGTYGVISIADGEAYCEILTKPEEENGHDSCY